MLWVSVIMKIFSGGAVMRVEEEVLVTVVCCSHRARLTADVIP